MKPIAETFDCQIYWRARVHRGVPQWDALPARRPRHRVNHAGPIQLGVVLLGVVLYLAAGIGIQRGVHSEVCTGADAAQGYTVFGPVGLILPHTSSSESLTNPFSGPSGSGAKDRSVRAASARSVIMDRCIRVAVRRCALLFPFHFFW
jgi:hypothetical protein